MSLRKTKCLIAGLAILGLVLVGNQALAVQNAIDVVPAATLLLPYFEVDLGGGVTTLFSVNNASAAPQLAHITLWTDMSRPTLDFTIYLTGYDVFTVNLRDLFTTGNLPPNLGPLVPPPPAANLATFSDGIDNQAGALSINSVADPQGDAIAAAEGASCVGNGVFPLPDFLPPNFVTFIRDVHRGLPAPAGFSMAGLCGAFPFGDGVARGYITIDNVRNCGIETPASGSTYFNNFAQTDSDENALWGDWFLADPLNNFAQGENLVHIETGEFGDGDYTFYGRYVDYDGSDNREPLASTWGARYFGQVPPFDGSDLLCWRDEGTDDTVSGGPQGYFSCTNLGLGQVLVPRIDSLPLAQNQIVIFDEEENPVQPESPPFSPAPVGQALTPCPWEANRTLVGGAGLPTPFAAGWLFLNLNTQVTGSFPANDELKQAWVGMLHSASGRFSVGFQGLAIFHTSTGLNLCIGPGRGDIDDCS